MVEETAGLASRMTRRLRKKEWTISTAESCTGGLLASLITDISGASQWFSQGWIVYSNEAKMRELGVEKSAFDEGEAGAVSHEVAVQMARGARYQSSSDVSIAITGIAGPGGSTADKEVGRVHVAVIAQDYFLVRRMDFGDNDRLDNKRSFAVFALRLALETLDRFDSVGIMDSYFPNANFFIEPEIFDRHLEKLKYVKDIELDYVSICTPNYLHAKMAIDSLQNKPQNYHHL